MEIAEKKFAELIKDRKQQVKMRNAVAKKFDDFSDKNMVRITGRHLRRTIGRINRLGGGILGIAGYLSMLLDIQDAQYRAEQCGVDVWIIMIEQMGVNVMLIDPETNEVIYRSPGVPLRDTL